MKGIDLFEASTWHPFASLGMHHTFLAINKQTIICTWVALFLIFLCVLPTRFILRSKSLLRYVVLSFVRSFIQLTEQTLGSLYLNHFYFMTSLFCFIFVCNILNIFPGLEEPTKDLNTALALGIISFVYTQVYAIKIQGLREYLKEYFSPLFIMLPINIIGKLSSLISISFRLFGNIFGGAAISHIYVSAIKGSLLFEIIGLLSGVNILITLFFGLFEGFLQAFVFSMLTITYLSMSMYTEESDEGAS
jgi:F-type H+-transporting ATPase subunit a